MERLNIFCLQMRSAGSHADETSVPFSLLPLNCIFPHARSATWRSCIVRHAQERRGEERRGEERRGEERRGELFLSSVYDIFLGGHCI